MKKKLKTILTNVLTLTISLFIGYLIGEGIIRMLYKNDIVLFPRYTTSAKYGDYTIRKIRPNEEYKHTSQDGVFRFKTNNKGFRNNYDVDYPKPEGKIRVLSIGDSHTQGAEVNQEETFSFVAEQALIKTGVGTEVINAGVAGFSTAEALIFLENEGISYDPDYVVLGFYANDYIDNIKSELFVEQSDSLVENKKEHIPGVKIQDAIYKWRIFKFLGENSYLYAYVFNTVWDFAKRQKRKNSAEKVITEYAIMTKEVDDYEKKVAKKLIQRLYHFCQQNDIKLIVIDIPRNNPIESSLNDLIPMVQSNSDTLFSTPALHSEYAALGKSHLPHGHNHISAESHHLLGNKIANFITTDLNQKRLQQVE